MKKYNWLISLLTLLLLVFTITNCKKKKTDGNVAVISLLKGNAKIFSKGKETKAKQNLILAVGDKIVLGKKSIAILDFKKDSARMELQENADLTIQSYSEINKTLFLKKGNAWTKFKKGGGSFSLKTPTTVASVRGTKFYTFQIGETRGTCFCEGKVKYKTKKSGFDKVNTEDYLVLTRDKKSVIVTQADIKAAGIKHTGHHHSRLANSPLGPEQKLSKKDLKIFLKLIEEKFAAVK